MTEIEQIPLNFVSDNTPNSKYPVLVYRNVLSGPMVDPGLDEALRKEHTKKLFQTNNWRPEVSQCHTLFSIIFSLFRHHLDIFIFSLIYIGHL